MQCSHVYLIGSHCQLHFVSVGLSVADPGGAPSAPPKSHNFFVLTQILKNVATMGVGTHPYKVGTPPVGNPGSATGCVSASCIKKNPTHRNYYNCCLSPFSVQCGDLEK